MSRFRNQTTGLPVWWVEALMLAVLYYAYTGSRAVADASTGEAMRMGRRLLDLETYLHIDIELGLNRWLQSVPGLAVMCCYYYATLHFIVTPAVLIWLHRRHIRAYSQARWTLVITTLICLLGFFLFPTAPPRLLSGTSYVDTMSHFEAWGWWTGSASAAPDGLEGLTNQYAALPSLHCAWSLWCGFLLFRFGRWRVVRVLGLLYPAATVFVVMSTSNHYLLDAVAGWAVLGVAAGLAVALMRAQARFGRGAAALSTPVAAPAPVPVGAASRAAGPAAADAVRPAPPVPSPPGAPEGTDVPDISAPARSTDPGPPDATDPPPASSSASGPSAHAAASPRTRVPRPDHSSA